ncbi:MAG: Minor capsid protein from bacteriophage [Bacteriophage sp.]|nr:MAG: Minor capsid protein from bacteriophage [Bacteriophage sp.]
MAVKSVLEGVTEYFLRCPLLKDGVFRVDALGSDPVEYTIETGIFDPVIQRYVDGSSERQYQFQFGSREFYSMDRVQNIENSTFYEEFADWVEMKSNEGELPELPKGMHAEELEVLSPGYIFDGAMKNARYQISLRLVYFKEAYK